MNSADTLPLVPLDEQSPLALFDAAQARQRSLINTLQLLCGAPDLGAPSTDVLAGALAGLERLAEDAERLYEAAYRAVSRHG
ncbi:MAG: hypothetical protein GAK43_01167 [Stenotrophomonas maltophilia]|nr:MAG: hypothetical protein GAK43_01167 [Stenotrophomonas maltophilia]